MNSLRNFNVDIYINQVEVDTHNFAVTYYVTVRKSIQFIVKYEIQEEQLYHLGFNIGDENQSSQEQLDMDTELLLCFFRHYVNTEHNAKYLYDLCHTIRQNNITFKSIYNEN